MNPLSQIIRPSKFGSGIFSDIIAGVNTGLSVYSHVPHGGSGACRAPAGCFQCRMTGRGDIAGCIDLLIAQVRIIQGQGDIHASLTASQNALAALSNQSYFATGDAYLASAIAAMTHDVNYYQGLLASGQTSTTALPSINPATGLPTVTPIAAPIIAGIPNSYLIGGTVAVLGLVYLLKK